MRAKRRPRSDGIEVDDRPFAAEEESSQRKARMQAAPLGSSFLQPRAESQSLGSPGQGPTTFKSRFDSIVKDGLPQRDTGPRPDMQPQDERTIRYRPEREKPPVEASEQRVGETNAATGSDMPKQADAASTDKGDDQEATAKPANSDPTESKPMRSDETEPDSSAAAAMAVTASVPTSVEEPTPDAAPQVVATEKPVAQPIQALQPTAEQIQTVMQPGETSDAVGDAVAQVSAAAKPVQTKPDGDKKLDAAVAQMDAVPGSTLSDTKAVDASARGNADGDASQLLDQAATKLPVDDKPTETKSAPSSFDRELTTLQNTPQPAAKPDGTQAAKMPPVQNLTPEQKFVQDNVDQVITSVQTQAVNGGGQMHVRLDPPELGALEVAVKMIDGRLTASFTTSNEQATQLLSHSLQSLKSSLETSGVNVDRIEVRQAPPSESSNSRSSSDSQQQQQQQRNLDGQSSQSEQNRKEMVRKMWRKLAFGTDDLDLVA